VVAGQGHRKKLPAAEITHSTPKLPAAEITQSTPKLPAAEITQSTPKLPAAEITQSTPHVKRKKKKMDILRAKIRYVLNSKY